MKFKTWKSEMADLKKVISRYKFAIRHKFQVYDIIN